MLCTFCSRHVPWTESGPIVSFSFDDFPRSALAEGARIIEGFGGRATYYVSMSLMNKSNALGEQFRLDDLYLLVDRGHELGSHTFSHCSSRKVRLDLFKNDVEQGERAIQQGTGITASNNFAYPYGEVTLKSKQALASMMRSCRGTCGGLNGGTSAVDLNLLRANSLYGDVDRLEMARKLILENERRKSWLIFYSHDVSARPSQFGCTPDLLIATVAAAARSGTRILPVGQVVAELERQPQSQLVV